MMITENNSELDYKQFLSSLNVSILAQENRAKATCQVMMKRVVGVRGRERGKKLVPRTL